MSLRCQIVATGEKRMVITISRILAMARRDWPAPPLIGRFPWQRIRMCDQSASTIGPGPGAALGPASDEVDYNAPAPCQLGG